jgi:hypothetical protein
VTGDVRHSQIVNRKQSVIFLQPSIFPVPSITTFQKHCTSIMVEIAARTLPRLGLGMAALGRPGYINLERGSILDKNDATIDDDVQRRS